MKISGEYVICHTVSIFVDRVKDHHGLIAEVFEDSASKTTSSQANFSEINQAAPFLVLTMLFHPATGCTLWRVHAVLLLEGQI